MERMDSRIELPRPLEGEPYELLTTKLAPPRLHPPYVPRKTLLARIDAGLDHKLTLISAPAGFGKTTLAVEWISRHLDQGTSTSFAWVSLDPGDNDPVRFWRYVLTSANKLVDGIGDTVLPVLNSSPQPPIQSILTLFINQAAQLSSKAVLVLEDYHAITEKQIHEATNFFIDHLPPSLHLILMTRNAPPLALARLRARNELNELRAEDLRFSLDEVRVFFEQALPFNLSPEMVVNIATHTEGWAAGLRLVSLALLRLEEEQKIVQFLDTFTGSHYPVLDYLIGDVFNALPDAYQRFLLQTSILSQLTGSLCDAITGRHDSALVLEQLERDNLFLVALDASQQWYRFHALFAEAMQHYAQLQLGEARLHELASVASVWYEGHNLFAEAVEVSLFARDYPRAAELIRRIITPRIAMNENLTLRRWIEQIPEQVLKATPEICLPYASAILFTSNRHSPATQARLQIPLQIAEDHWQAVKDHQKLGEVFAFRSLVGWLQGDYKESVSFARQALERLPDDDRQWRGTSLIMLGLGELIDGKLYAARQSLSEARALSEVDENIYVLVSSLVVLGDVCYRQGDLHLAAQIFKLVLEKVENAPMDRDTASIRKGQALLGLGMLDLEWNKLEAAEQSITQAVAICQQFPGEYLLADSPIFLAEIYFARGEVAQAKQLADSLVAKTNRPFLFRSPRIYHARQALASGDLSAVQRWFEVDALPGDEVSAIQFEQVALIVARLRIEQGEAGAAIDLLKSWIVKAQDNGRARSELEIQIILAQAYAALGDRQQAKHWLLQALILARPEGYQRIFLHEGRRLAELLRDIYPEIGEEALAGYARVLLYTMAEEQTRRDISPQVTGLLIEPLSDQEQRVLRLLAAGLSNPEIAGELVISINTVKTHVKNIYGKLAVNSRQDAREAARHLKLL